MYLIFEFIFALMNLVVIMKYFKPLSFLVEHLIKTKLDEKLMTMNMNKLSKADFLTEVSREVIK